MSCAVKQCFPVRNRPTKPSRFACSQHGFLLPSVCSLDVLLPACEGKRWCGTWYILVPCWPRSSRSSTSSCTWGTYIHRSTSSFPDTGSGLHLWAEPGQRYTEDVKFYMTDLVWNPLFDAGLALWTALSSPEPGLDLESQPFILFPLGMIFNTR